MNAALTAPLVVTDVIALPLVLTVVLAAAALLASAVNVRCLRRAGRLTGAEAASAVSAVGIRFSAPPAIVRLGTRRIVHTAIVDHDENVLGCIDQLEKNGELIRLDGGVHWFTCGSLHDARENLRFSSPRDHLRLAPGHEPGGILAASETS